MDAIGLLRSIFLLMASTITLANVIPGVQRRFITYGARSSSAEKTNGQEPSQARKSQNEATEGYFTILLNFASNIRVPHAWFFHFYVLSLSLSLFWAFQVVTQGDAFSFIAVNSPLTEKVSMTIHQVLLVWSLMTVHGMRRLYESFQCTSVSGSSMWIAHWGLGLVFYTCMSVAVWIEGIPAISSNNVPLWRLLNLAPSLKSFFAVPLFLGASGIQYDCHDYLASLKKYSLPVHPIFQVLICPHYFAECMIYISLALAGAPPGRLLNGTISCALVFVAVNLGVTARNTRQWYANKFGEDKIKDRWIMIPFVW